MIYTHFLDKVQVIDENSIHHLETGRVCDSVMNYYRIVALDCGCVEKFFLCSIACQGYGDPETRYSNKNRPTFGTCAKHQKTSNS